MTESRPTVAKKYAGRWIAWDKAQRRIVGSGHTLQDAKRAAEKAGETHPVLAKAPAAKTRFVGEC